MEDLPYSLEDVETAQKESLDAFSIPSSLERKNLKPGQLVKLIFIIKNRKENNPRAERMWVKIEKIFQKGYSGVLDNDPIYFSDLKAGDTIIFRPENIVSIYEI